MNYMKILLASFTDFCFLFYKGLVRYELNLDIICCEIGHLMSFTYFLKLVEKICFIPIFI